MPGRAGRPPSAISRRSSGGWSGHRSDFIEAFGAWHEAAASAGLPAYRLYESDWGTYGEVFASAQFEDIGDIDRRIGAASGMPAYEATHNAVLGHLVDGEMRDYALIEVEPG